MFGPRKIWQHEMNWLILGTRSSLIEKPSHGRVRLPEAKFLDEDSSWSIIYKNGFNKSFPSSPTK
jgi:hypothetical protein